MSRKALAGVAALTLVAGSFLASSMSFAQPAGSEAAAAGVYTIDPVHSSAVYRILHMNAGAHWGAVKEPTGTVEVTADGVKIDVTLELAKLDSANRKRDEHLRSPDFFNAKQFPTMTFKSTESKKIDGGYEVKGDLTIKDKTQPITVELKHTGTGAMGEKALVGFETDFTVSRAAFGVGKAGGVADEVRVILAVEANK